MVITLNAGITHGGKSRISYPSIHPGKHEFNNNYDPRDNGGNYHHNLRVCIKQMVRRQYNPLLSVFRRNSGFRFDIQYDNSRQRLLTRDSNQSSKSSSRGNRNRKNYRNFCYYGILVCLLAIGKPSYAEEGETNNTSNPVAAATGNVTNQAVQFQNNGAPSRQIIGPNISCNGATMTFSPFYMGNHTTPYDEHMDQQSYTLSLIHI